MEFRLLGPLEVYAGGIAVGIRGRRQRAVLAALAVNANRVVTVDRLVAAAWEEPPLSAEANVRTHVMALRRLLDAVVGESRRLVTRPHGYLLEAGPGEVDLAVFEDLTTRGERALAVGDLADSVRHFQQACGLWRGQPLEGVPLAGPLRVEAERLAERRLIVVERCLHCRLLLGEHAALVDELRSLVLTHPLRERLWEQLVLALYRSGRQGDALATYGEVRELLADELGIDPNPELQLLQHRILHADPALQSAAILPANGALPRDVPARVPGDSPSLCW